jgi:hypothetical protein
MFASKPKTTPCNIILQVNPNPFIAPKGSSLELLDHYTVGGVTGTVTDGSFVTSTVGVTGTVGAGVGSTVTLTG